ncbi:MAG: flavin reductase family protein [Sphingomonadaceae bacterium]|nr:flavin reductase family protein [Sphingomonadaceae bacterium]
MKAESKPHPVAETLTHAMRRFVSSVTVISLREPDGSRNAITATSSTSVSMAPPSMLFCVHRDSSIHAGLHEGARFCINILAKHQEDVSRMCSSKIRGEERFAVGNWRESEAGVPYLADAEAAVLCSVVQCVPFGSHDIIIGAVEQVHLRDPREPLIYFNGQYATIA